MALLLGVADRRARRAVVRHAGRARARLLPRPRRGARRAARCSSRRSTRSRNSLRFAVAATVIAVVVGGCAAFAARRRRGGARSTRSSSLPARRLGGDGRVRVPHRARPRRRSTCAGSWWLVPIAQALVAIPFVVRIDDAGAARHRPAPARGGGDARRGPGRVWREVDLPIVARAALVAAGFAFAISLGEFGATVFIVRPDQPTLPVLVYRLLGQPGPLQLRRRDGRERDPDGAHRARHPRHRALSASAPSASF